MDRLIRAQLSAERLRQLMSYEPLSGEFFRSGRSAGSVNGSGYVQIRIDGRIYLAHRLAFLWMDGRWPDGHVDHIDGARRNNRFANLRVVSPRLNAENQRSAHKDSSTGFLGVERSGCGYQARIMSNGKRVGLGSFPTAEAAHRAYVQAKRKIHTGGTL